jgi:hypothetical protein
MYGLFCEVLSDNKISESFSQIIRMSDKQRNKPTRISLLQKNFLLFSLLYTLHLSIPFNSLALNVDDKVTE